MKPASRSSASSIRRWWRVAAGLYGLLIAAAVLSSVVSACRRKAESTVTRLPSSAPAQTSESCRECHEEAHARWHDTDHALANRAISAAVDQAAFEGEVVGRSGAKLHVAWDESGPEIRLPTRDGEAPFRPELVLGNKPLRQFLVPAEGGRWQPVDVAWDPVRKDWFNVFGDEQRRPGEWGHWTGRGMNWNSMCAHCHMTGFRKNYDEAEDVYRSTWVEHGVGCIQCHGPMPEGHGAKRASAPAGGGPLNPTWIRDRHRAMDTCAYCHARNEALTEEFPPGADYHDHFRVTLPVEPGVFHPDGQQLDEDFNWTSVLLSRMHHAGVTCMDCHDPHSNATILPVENNALCQQCHAPPGRVMPGTGVSAPAIDPTAHSRHPAGSAGNQCVSCHMPTKDYMVRAPRHDHGWLKPDPLLTQELDIPNACSSCHSDRPVEWAVKAAEEWYGPKLDSRQRARARAVATAQRRDEKAVEALLRLIEGEDIPAWRATYIQLLAPWTARDEVTAAARAGLADASPLVRSAAVQALSGNPAARPALRPLLEDPVRLVRLDAAWALSDELDPNSALARELQEYLHLSEDQPAGQLRLGQFFANIGSLSEADEAMARATQWDPYSAPIFETRAIVLQMLGRPADAAAALSRAAQLQPEDGEVMMRAALAFGEAGRMKDAEVSLRAAVAREPGLHRAWYNLGLVLAQFERLDEAEDALARAEELAPRVADYPYALATVLLRQGNREAAAAAAERTLAVEPGHRGARQVLQAVRGGR